MNMKYPIRCSEIRIFILTILLKISFNLSMKIDITYLTIFCQKSFGLFVYHRITEGQIFRDYEEDLKIFFLAHISF